MLSTHKVQKNPDSKIRAIVQMVKKICIFLILLQHKIHMWKHYATRKGQLKAYVKYMSSWKAVQSNLMAYNQANGFCASDEEQMSHQVFSFNLANY